MSTGKEEYVARTTAVDKILEVVRRLGALGFAAVYTHTHGSPRDSSLRVAELAYRFLKGESAASINLDADAQNHVREQLAHKKLKLKNRSKNHG